MMGKVLIKNGKAYVYDGFLLRWITKNGKRFPIINKEKISGGMNPDGDEAEEYAKWYYGVIEKRKNDYKRIAKNTGYTEEEIKSIKDYIFSEKHNLKDGYRKFDPSYAMAESWRRLTEGKEIQPHDLVLLKHELLEMKMVREQGIPQPTAHNRASKIYNYGKGAKEFYGNRRKHYKGWRKNYP